MSVDLEKSSGTKVFVGGLAWETKDEDLREAFEKFGKIEMAEVIVDRNTQKSRGFGFVTFETKEDAMNAINEMVGFELQGREIRCDFATSKGSRRENGDGPRRFRDGPYDRRDRNNGRRDYHRRDYDRRGRDDRRHRGYDRRNNGRDYENRDHGRRDRYERSKHFEDNSD